MEEQTEKQRPVNGQLISVPHRDTIRLLEVYVKRSLSLNDGNLGHKSAQRKEKWVTKKPRRHSSDPSLHLAEGENNFGSGTFSAVVPSSNEPEASNPEEPEKPTKKSKKSKKSSFWKNIFGFFSRKSNEDKDDEQDSSSEAPKDSTETDVSDAVITCLPTTPVTSQKKKTLRRKSLRRRFSKRRISLIRPNKPDTEVSEVEAVVSVEPTYSYYEKVTEELKKIVNEVKEEVQPLSDEEALKRLTALIKDQGDAIDEKLKDNPTLNNFFQGMTYASFQKLADAYLEKEAMPTHKPPTVLPTAPELVKLAFTFDFTAKIAGLSKQNIGHITGLGNRYLQDRFEYKQMCTDHPWSDSDD